MRIVYAVGLQLPHSPLLLLVRDHIQGRNSYEIPAFRSRSVALNGKENKMPSGVRRLGRKRFAEAVKYLKTVIADGKRPDRLRMQAVESLLTIYDRNDRTLAQYEARRRAAESAQGTGQPSEPSEEPDSTVELVNAFIERIKAGHGAKGAE